MTLKRTVDEVTPDVIRMRYLFVNVYFIGSPDGWVLVDAGLQGCADDIVEVARERFGGVSPQAIVMTHGHFDHVGAFPELFEHWDVPVFAHPLESPFLTGERDYPEPDPTVGKGAMALLSFAYPNGAIDLGQRLEPLLDEQTVPHLPGWRWIHTPGHTQGHVSLYRDQDRLLIAGDAFVTTEQESLYAVVTQKEEVHGPPAYFTPDWGTARLSVETLAALGPEIAATGHGTPMRGDALRAGLDRLARDFDEIAMPDHGRYVPDDDGSGAQSAPDPGSR